MINLNVKVFFETHKMMGKYDVVNINKPGGGGERIARWIWMDERCILKLWFEIKEKQVFFYE